MKTARITLTEQQFANLAGLLGIASQAIGASLAQAGLNGLQDAQKKLADAVELVQVLEAATQPKPKKGG